MTRFEEMIDNYCYHIQNITDDYYKEHLTNLTSPKVEVDPKGRKYKKVVVRDRDGSSCRVHSFVEVETGNVYKAKGWKAPELNHVRANIYDYESIKRGVNMHGANYIVR